MPAASRPTLLIAAPGDDAALHAELRRAYPRGQFELIHPGLTRFDSPLPDQPPPILVFARQALPEAAMVSAPSIREWAGFAVSALIEANPEARPWRLHVIPHYDSPAPDAGLQRCRLIRDGILELLRRRRRSLLRSLADSTDPFQTGECLAQLLLTAPGEGAFSHTPVPSLLDNLLSPFPRGEVPIAVDKAAPARAFAKLLEAESRLGAGIRAGERCVDLGASPGSWSYVALQRGASVVAVDRAPLRDDLMRHPNLAFVRGDAFGFEPDAPVDWLLCDVIAAPARTLELMQRWIERRLCRRFAVTIKFKGDADYPLLDRLKPFLARHCARLVLKRLCSNRNEACAAGILRDAGTRPDRRP